MVLKRLKLHQF